MNSKMLERWKLKTKGIFHKIVYDEFWFYIDDLMKENKKLTNNWNELEKWCKNNLGYYGSDIGVVYKYVLDKMKKIKEKDNE